MDSDKYKKQRPNANGNQTPHGQILEGFMDMAIGQALSAKRRGDYAIGAVVVRNNNEVLASFGNRVRTLNDSSRHVEMEALTYAKGAIKDRYLSDCALFSTHAPCPMCITACAWLGIHTVYFGVTQSDMQKFSEGHGTEELRWRSVPVEPHEIYTKYLQSINPNMKIIKLMWKECLELLLV